MTPVSDAPNLHDPAVPRGRRVRTGWVLLLCALLVGCTATVPGTRSRPATGESPTALEWSACEDQYQCAALSVPLDWSDPEGESIELALIRRPADGPDPIGSLLVNPGGPGEPGTGFLPMWLTTGVLPEELTERFDLVSWDPRGTGGSVGIACVTDEEYLEPDPLPYPRSAAERDRVTAEADESRERCLTERGEVIPHVGTRATVRDLDAIRDALGDDQLTYLGYSYGTVIGLEYLRMFPERVRAIVLDGVSLPGTDPVATTRAQMRSFEDNLERFSRDCARDPACPITGEDPYATITDLLDELAEGTRLPASYVLPDESGTTHQRDGTLGYTEAVTGIATGLYSTDSWPILQSGLAAATRGDDPDGHILLMLRDLLRGRQLDGTWNHSAEANTAINCADQRARASSYFGDVDQMGRWADQMPVFGRFGAAGLPGCHRWPDALDPLEELTARDLADAPGVVIVNSEHDPATPYENALEARDLLERVSLVTWGGADHTAFGSGIACVDDAVVPYLVDRQMPPPEVRCDP